MRAERYKAAVDECVLTGFAVIGSKATATFTSQNGKQEALTMRGNFFDTTADIIDEAQGGMFNLMVAFQWPCFVTSRLL